MTIEERLSAVSNAIADAEWQDLSNLLSEQFFDYSPRDDEPTARERIVEIASDLKASMPDLIVSFDDQKRGEDGLEATLSLVGTHANALWGSPGTGKALNWAHPVTIKLVDDGVAFRLDDFNPLEAFQVLRQLELINEADAMDRPVPHPVAIPEFLLKLIMTGRPNDRDCNHLEQTRMTEPATRICEQCFAEGTMWPALRMCLTCGFVGCCDLSKNKHMKGHHEETGHPLMRSIHLNEGWSWCYEDDAFFESGTLAQHGNR